MQGKHLGILMVRLWGLGSQDSEPGAQTRVQTTFVPNGGMKMRIRIVSAAALCLLAASSAFAQNTQIDDIVGAGTTNYVPVFTGSHRIGNSLIYQTGGKIGIGTTAPGFPIHILRNNLFAPPGEAPSAFAVETAAQSDTETVAAIQGLATSTTGGGATAILGTAYGANSIGLFGNSTSNSGGGGVVGSTASADFSFSAAIAAWALANTGSAVAVFAQTYSPNGTAGYFLNRAGGNIIVGHVGRTMTRACFASIAMERSSQMAVSSRAARILRSRWQ